MALTAEEKARRARERKLEKAREFSTSTYARQYVAGVFQRMIRAEYAASPCEYFPAIIDGELRQVRREVGQVVCVTCGRVARWDDKSTINTGHFVAGRSNSILFEELNVAPQCVACNCHGSGQLLEYNQWMESVRGREAIDRLRALKATTRSFDREELVDMLIEYTERLKIAKEAMSRS